MLFNWRIRSYVTMWTVNALVGCTINVWMFQHMLLLINFLLSAHCVQVFSFSEISHLKAYIIKLEKSCKSLSTSTQLYIPKPITGSSILTLLWSLQLLPQCHLLQCHLTCSVQLPSLQVSSYFSKPSPSHLFKCTF